MLCFKIIYHPKLHCLLPCKILREIENWTQKIGHRRRMIIFKRSNGWLFNVHIVDTSYCRCRHLLNEQPIYPTARFAHCSMHSTLFAELMTKFYLLVSIICILIFSLYDLINRVRSQAKRQIIVISSQCISIIIFKITIRFYPLRPQMGSSLSDL